MAINRWCRQCKQGSKLGAKKCRRCGMSLSGAPYRVRVKLPGGRWRTKIATDLRKARQVENGFKSEGGMHQVGIGQGQLVVGGQPGGMGDSTPKLLLRDVWKLYLEYAKVNKASWKDDVRRWTAHLKPELGKRPIDEVKAWEVQQVLTKMQNAKTRRGKPYAPATVRQVFMLIKRLFNWALQQDLYDGLNPTNKIKLKPFDNRATRALSVVDLPRLIQHIDAWDNERAMLVIKFALYSGKRRGEILHLQWPNVDFHSGLVTFQGATTKNGRTQILPVNEQCWNVLGKCRELMICDYVFPCKTGKFYSSFDNVWKRMRKKLDLPYRFHDLRHTFATYLASSGKVDIYTLQHLLGHRDIAMTQRYAHLFNGALKRGADAANDVFNELLYRDSPGADGQNQTATTIEKENPKNEVDHTTM